MSVSGLTCYKFRKNKQFFHADAYKNLVGKIPGIQLSHNAQFLRPTGCPDGLSHALHHQVVAKSSPDDPRQKKKGHPERIKKEAQCQLLPKERPDNPSSSIASVTPAPSQSAGRWPASGLW